MIDRCLMCFAARTTSSYLETNVHLCRGCTYQVDKIVGFWETHGYGLQLVLINYEANQAQEEDGVGSPLTPQGSPEPPDDGIEEHVPGDHIVSRLKASKKPS